MSGDYVKKIGKIYLPKNDYPKRVSVDSLEKIVKTYPPKKNNSKRVSEDYLESQWGYIHHRFTPTQFQNL